MRMILLAIFLLSTMSAYSKSTDDFNLYFVRHAEKSKLVKKNPPLNQKGQQTAQALGNWFRDKDIPRIYTTNYLRTMETAAAVALNSERLIEKYDPGTLKDLAAKLLSEKKAALIVGHSNTTPVLIRLVGGTADDIPESEYGVLYEVVFVNGHVVKTNQYLFAEKNSN